MTTNQTPAYEDGAHYLDRHGDTWKYLGGIEEFLHVKRADEDTPVTGPNIVRHCEDAVAVARDFGPMAKVSSTPVDGPFPIRVNTTPSGCELDLSAFLMGAVFTELITAADEDPEGLVDELKDMAGLLRSAVHQGRDSHARHEFDERMLQMLKEYANDGMVPVYGEQVARLRDRLDQIATPRPVPAHHEAGAA